MIKFFLFLVFIIAMTGCKSQNTKALEQIENLFLSISERTEHTYLADTTINNYPFTYSDLKYRVSVSDTGLLKMILLEGTKRNLELGDTKDLLSNSKFVKFDNFNLIETKPFTLTTEETKLLASLDSIEKLRTNELLEKDSTKYIYLYKLQEELTKSDAFNSYRKKLENSDKRLLVIYPLFEYKDILLLTIVNYNSKTNSDLIVKILR